VIVLGAVVRVATLLLTSVIIVTTCPTVNGPSAFPLKSSGTEADDEPSGALPA
jgi:hypothetical protein